MPQHDAIVAWFYRTLPTCLPESGLHKAIGYMVHMWPGLVLFLDDPKIDDAISFAKAKLLPYSSNGVRANRALAFPIAAAAREVAAKIDSDFAFDLSAFGAAPTGDSARAEATPELAGLFA